MAIEIGNTVEGIIIKLMDYGAIVRLAGGKMGLVHISEVADTYVRDMHDYLKESDRVYVKVLKINDRGRYELSVKQADTKVVRHPERPAATAPAPPKKMDAVGYNFEPVRECKKEKIPVTFEDKLSRFLKDSEERQVDLKRNLEAKRGSRRK
ncbi:MAG: S1 RNA-binding domain-containing protein [Armatimonadota bacterium]